MMNASGILLDTGPLVAFLSRNDNDHRRALHLFNTCEAPFRTCEAVLTEACFLMQKVHINGPAEVVALARAGLYEVALSVTDHAAEIEALLRKYANRGISLADAGLIRCAELHEEPRILTFDSDFTVYRWSRGKPFHVL
jgi:predicted nucleic acid-binding protein